MKKQMQGVALILFGIQLTLLGGMDLRSMPVIGAMVRDNGNVVILLPALVAGAVGLFLCFRSKDG